MNLRIKKLDKFIAKQFLLLFAGTFFICLFVLMMQFLWRFIDELIGKGLSMEVLAQFFEYMALMMVPQALPLAILLSSLITFGNLGESSELTAIKAAGISLMQSFRSLIVITVAIMAVSFYFQNNIGPNANMKLMQLLVSMKQKSPELEIPEGIFYDGLPNCNIYVQKKNIKTGKLYGIMIYRMTDSYEDAAIILADSGMIQSTAEKKHLLLSLWSGEWFENMRESDLGGSAAVPYRRETFTDKKVLLDFDNNFSLMDAAALSNNAAGKSLSQIRFAIDSLNATYDSIGRAFWNDTKQMCFPSPRISKKDSLGQVRAAQTGKIDIDKRLRKSRVEQRAEGDVGPRLQVHDDTEQRARDTQPRAGGAKQVCPRLAVHHLLLHWRAAWSHHTKGRIGNAYHHIGAGVHSVLHSRQLRLPHVKARVVADMDRPLAGHSHHVAAGGLRDI